jgi:hypothetical protein
MDFDQKKHGQKHNRVANEMLERATQNSGINFLRE